jgi:hypothetical protein
MHTSSMSGGSLKPGSGWQNFLATVSDRRFLAVPIVTWAILRLLLLFGGNDVKNVIDFITH